MSRYGTGGPGRAASPAPAAARSPPARLRDRAGTHRCQPRRRLVSTTPAVPSRSRTSPPRASGSAVPAPENGSAPSPLVVGVTTGGRLVAGSVVVGSGWVVVGWGSGSVVVVVDDVAGGSVVVVVVVVVVVLGALLGGAPWTA